MTTGYLLILIFYNAATGAVTGTSQPIIAKGNMTECVSKAKQIRANMMQQRQIHSGVRWQCHEQKV